MLRGFGIAMLLLAPGCGGGSGPAPIHVGHVATLSGPNKQAGEQAARAIRLAVEEHNKDAAQKNLRPIVVRHTDTRGRVEAFEAEAVRLTTINRVQALLGGTTAAEVARLDKAQVPLVTAGPRMRGLSELVYFTGLAAAFQGQVLARFAVQDLRAKKIVVLVDERQEEPLALAEAFSRELGKAAGNKEVKAVPHFVTWRYGEKLPPADWAKRLAEEKPDTLLLAGAARDVSRIRESLHFTGRLLFAGAEGSARAFLETRDADGVYLVTAFVRDVDVARGKEFVTAYREKFSEDPDVHAALAYDSARLLFDAIDRSQPPGIESAIREIPNELSKLKDFPGLTGPLGFNDERQLLRPAFIVQVDQGVLKTIRRFPPAE